MDNHSTSSQPDHQPSRPTLTLRPESNWSAINLAQLWQFRDLFFTLAQRDVKLRYKQTVLGILWVVIQPLLAAGIFTFIFGKVARLPSEGTPYFLFSFAGLLAWNVFSSTLAKAGGSLVAHSGLVAKVFFPRLILPLSTAYSSLIDFGVSLAMLAGLMVIYDVTPGIQVLLLPVWLLFILFLALGIGMVASALAVSYRDVNYILPVFINLLLYASPVAYSLENALARIEPQYHIFFSLNPLSSLVTAVRWSLLNTQPPQWSHLLVSMVLSFAVFTGGAFAFKRMERRFADVI